MNSKSADYETASTDDYDSMSDDELSIACEQIGVRRSSRENMLKQLREDNAYILQLRTGVNDKSSDGYNYVKEMLNASGSLMSTILTDLKQKKMKESKFVDVTIKSIGMKPDKYTAGGAPSVTADVLKSLAGDPFRDPPKYGSAYKFFGGGDKGHEASVALYSLTAIGSIDTMIATFLTSLQELADHDSRVHCSLNLNTETGRLSSRKPNLQNQPALEKDKYKIRKAFRSSPGNNLIVADYGQLELRLLASMTKCRSMIDAFAAGGDFHSRTAMGMFDYIQQQVDNGECLLEWDFAKGDPPKPLLKDKFASERRKAKTLNFSIAYGKTAHGLSQDWGVSLNEAEEMLGAWYRSRPEVLKWQQHTKELAREHGITRTLMGRYRQLPAAMSSDRKLRSQGERASINTPIQGKNSSIVVAAEIRQDSYRMFIFIISKEALPMSP
jgi:DNA polymerase-1